MPVPFITSNLFGKDHGSFLASACQTQLPITPLFPSQNSPPPFPLPHHEPPPFPLSPTNPSHFPPPPPPPSPPTPHTLPTPNRQSHSHQTHTLHHLTLHSKETTPPPSPIRPPRSPMKLISHSNHTLICATNTVGVRFRVLAYDVGI